MCAVRIVRCNNAVLRDQSRVNLHAPRVVNQFTAAVTEIDIASRAVLVYIVQHVRDALIVHIDQQYALAALAAFV